MPAMEDFDPSETTLFDLKRVLEGASRVFGERRNGSVLGRVRVPNVEGGHDEVELRLRFDDPYPSDASYKDGVIEINARRFVDRRGSVRLDDLEMMLMHELTHGRDAAKSPDKRIFRRAKERLGATGRWEPLLGRLRALLGPTYEARLRDRRGAGVVDVRALILAESAVLRQDVRSLLLGAGIGEADQLAFLYVYLLSRSLVLMNEGYPGADEDYYRSESEQRAYATMVFVEVGRAIKAARSAQRYGKLRGGRTKVVRSDVPDMIARAPTYRRLRKHLAKKDIATVAETVERAIVRRYFA